MCILNFKVDFNNNKVTITTTNDNFQCKNASTLEKEKGCLYEWKGKKIVCFSQQAKFY